MEIKTKADIGDEIFFMSNNTVNTVEVEGIIISVKNISQMYYKKTKIIYIIGTLELDENQVFLTKQDLLDSL